MRSSDPLRLSGYGGGRRWRLVGVAEGRETPKGRGASGGGRTGGGRGIPKTGRATSGGAKTPRRSPRPAGTAESASYGRGRTASGRSVPEPRTGRGAADRDAATGDSARRGPRTPAAARPPASEGARRPARPPAADGTRRARPPAPDGARRTARPPAADGERRTARPPAADGARRTTRPPAREGTRPATGRPFGDGARRSSGRPGADGAARTPGRSFGAGTRGTGPSTRTFRSDGPRRTEEGSSEGSVGFERGPRTRSAEGGDRRAPSGTGRRSWDRDRDEAPARPARGRSDDRPAERRGASRPWTARPDTDRSRTARPGSDRSRTARPGTDRSRTARPGSDYAPPRGPRAAAANRDGAAYRPRESGPRGSGPRESGPRLPDTISAAQLDAEARTQLNSLPNDLADTVARYLVAAGTAEDPEQGYEYAQVARRLAARVGVVREATGIAAYQTGRWAEALAELRAARRLTGRDDYLPLMADSERALGRPDRALALIREADTSTLDRATQIELRIVESGIRRDQGLADAAVIPLQVPELTSPRLRPWSVRLFYAYADALLAAGRTEQSRDAFARAAAADADGQTDAAERLDELDGIAFEDLADDSDDSDEFEDSEEISGDPV